MRVAQMGISPSVGLLLVAGLLLAALSLAILVSGPKSDAPSRDRLGSTSTSAEINSSIAFWEERVTADPYDFVAHNKLAQSYLRRARETGDVADYTRAETAVTASLERSRGDNFVATALLASIQNTKHQFGDAIVTARRAIAMDPGDPSGYAMLGDAQLALGQYDEALENYERIVTIGPGLTSFSRLAHVKELLGDVVGADLAWQNALSTDGGRMPENTAWAHAQYGDFHFRLGRLKDAEASYEESLETVPGFVQALAGVANVLAAEGDYATAIDLYDTIVVRQPMPNYAATLGDLYAAVGNNDAAARHYNLVLAIAALYQANGIDTDLETALFLADHELNLHDAVRQARAIYARQPDSIYAADALAWTLHRNGQTEEAQEYVRQAIRLGTPDPMLYFHAGVVAKAAGELDEARQHLAKASDLNPRFSVLHADTLASALDGLPVSQ